MSTKRCFKCLCEKPLDAFYKHSRMKDGRLNKCIDCTKNDVSKHRQENLEKVRQYDKMRASMPHRIAARKEYTKTESYAKIHKAANANWIAKHPERRKASHIVNNAIKNGKLIPWPVCAIPECQGKPQGHHPDYSRPLDVVWLCPKHHKQAHAIADEYFKQQA